MFANFKTKVVDRKKLTKLKISFVLQVHKVILPNSYQNEKTDEVNVSFQRGGKVSSTDFKALNPKCSEIEFNQSLSHVCTMFSSTNEIKEVAYQSKISKVIVRMKKGGKGSPSVIGVVPIDLDKYASAYAGTDLELELEQCSVLGASVHVTIVPQVLDDDLGDDDTLEDDSTRPSMDGSSHFSTDEFVLRKTKSLRLSGTFMNQTTDSLESSTTTTGERSANFSMNRSQRSKSMYVKQVSDVSSFSAADDATQRQPSVDSLTISKRGEGRLISSLPDDDGQDIHGDGDSNAADGYDIEADPPPETREMHRSRSSSATVRFRTPSMEDQEDSTFPVSKEIVRSKSARFPSSALRTDSPLTRRPQRSSSVRFSSTTDDSRLPTSSSTEMSHFPTKGRRASVQFGSSLESAELYQQSADRGCAKKTGVGRRASLAMSGLLGSKTGNKDKVSNAAADYDSSVSVSTAELAEGEISSDGNELSKSDASSKAAVDFDTISEKNVGAVFKEDAMGVLDRMTLTVSDIQNAQDRLLGSVHYLRNDDKLSGFVAGVSEEYEGIVEFLVSLKECINHLESHVEAFVVRMEMTVQDKEDLENELDTVRVEQHLITETELHAEKMKLMRQTEKQKATIINLTSELQATRDEVKELREKLEAAEALEASHNLETYYLNQGRLDMEKKYEKLKKQYSKLDKSPAVETFRDSRSPSIDITNQPNAVSQQSVMLSMHEKEMERVYRKVSELKNHFIRYRARVDVRRTAQSNDLLVEQMMRKNSENEVAHANKVISTLRKQVAHLEDAKKEAQSKVSVISNIDHMDKDDLTVALINAKVQVASLAMENDEERKRSQNMKAQLKMYTKRITNLEIELGNR